MSKKRKEVKEKNICLCFYSNLKLENSNRKDYLQEIRNCHFL